MAMYPRKSYWTIVRYLGSSVLTMPDLQGQQTVFLFSSEKKATNFLKERIKVDKDLKKSIPFIDALSSEVLTSQAQASKLVLKLVE